MLKITGTDNNGGLRAFPLDVKGKGDDASVIETGDPTGGAVVDNQPAENDNHRAIDESFSDVPMSGDVIYAVHSENVDSEEINPDFSVVNDVDNTDDVVVDENASDAQVKNLLAANEELTVIEQIKVDNLKKIDANVKRHERSHMNVGGQYAGAAKYTYTEGPDGERYAVEGSVDIDISEVQNNPRATIEKMQVVKRAALAPSDPSNEDRQVANKASATEAKARRELKEEDDSLKNNALFLYNRMVMLYGKNNVKSFSTFSFVAQDS